MSLVFECKKVKKKQHVAIINNDEEIWEANLPSDTIRNKCKLIVGDLNKVTSSIDGMADDLVEVISEFKTQYLSDPIVKFIDKYYPAVLEFVKEYGYKETQQGHSKLFMTPEEIEYVLAAGVMCKYAILFLSHLDSYHGKQVITAVYRPLIENDLIRKLLHLIASKITPFRHSDTKMWAFLKLVVSKTPETHTTGLLAFILKSILPICTLDRNPIVYILSVAGECIKWVVHGVYDPPEFSRNIPSSVTDISNALDNIVSMKVIEQVKVWCINNSNRKDITDLISQASYNTLMQLLIVKLFKNLFNISGSVVKRLAPDEIFYICYFMYKASKYICENNPQCLEPIECDIKTTYTININKSYTTVTIPITTHPIRSFANTKGIGKLLTLIPYQKKSATPSYSLSSALLYLPINSTYTKYYLHKQISEICTDINSYKYLDIDTSKVVTYNSKLIGLDLIALIYQHYKFDMFKLLEPIRDLVTDSNVTALDKAPLAKAI